MNTAQTILKAVIVEDEFIAAQNLERQLGQLDQKFEILTVLQSVDESVEWFSENKHPDIVFMDIHLADGDSFSIFEQIEISSPIIFTTAYDEYALKAFEVNSIDYLLKPIKQENLKKALDKLSNLAGSSLVADESNSNMVEKILQTIRENKNQYKKNFLIPFKDKLIPVPADDIAFIMSEYKMAKMVTFSGQRYTIDTSLDEMMRQLNPDKFYRANRQYIVAHRAITDMSIWFNGKLAVNLSVPTDERIIVSRAKSNELKDWFSDNSH